MNFKSLLVTLGLCAASLTTLAADITGAGATFPYPIYAKWAEAYKKQTGTGLNYQSIGSSGGLKQIRAKTVTFGASDAPVSGPDLDKDGMVQFPAIIGGTVPVVNLDGFKPGELRITGNSLHWVGPSAAKVASARVTPSDSARSCRTCSTTGCATPRPAARCAWPTTAARSSTTTSATTCGTVCAVPG